MTNRPVVVAATCDVLAIVAFVAVGRRSHDEGNALREMVRVATPFLIGLVAGWLAARAWKAPTTIATALVVWPITVAGGLILRRFAFSNGTALAFIIVATVVLGALLVGWRAVYRAKIGSFGPEGESR